jgi:Flp pilus assembly protein TadG
MRRTNRTRRRGAAIVEFAVLLPFLLFLLLIAIDWARMLYFTQCVNDCARSGALWASDQEVQMQSRYTNLTDAALAESPGLSPTATVTQTTTTDAKGNPLTVTVTVSMQFDTIANFQNMVGGFGGPPKSQTITRSVTMSVAPMNSR